MSGKGLLAIGLAVIAAVFLALVIQARSDEAARRQADAEEPERLETFDTCDIAVRRALDAAGDRVEEMFGAGTRAHVRAVALRRCLEDKWPMEVTSCLESASDASSLSRCIGQLDPDAHSALMSELESLPRDPPPPDAAIDAPVPVIAQDDDEGPPACVEYGRMIERLSTCDKLPEATRTALTEAYAQVRQSWKTIPRDSWDALDTGCEQAVDAMKQAMATMCP